MVVWAADYRLWGGMRRLWTAVDGNDAKDLSVMWRPPAMSEGCALCPIRFQGQCEDAETGLRYNRYHTYHPASAPYLSPDPIGIAGGIKLPVPTLDVQREVSATLKKQIGAIDLARQAARSQIREISSLAGAIVMDTIRNSPTKPYLLGDVLDEVKQAIGAPWADHPVLGATREGLAPAKEQPGKMAPKYKPVTPGTVFRAEAMAA